MKIFTLLKNLFSWAWRALDSFRKVLHLLLMLFFFAVLLSALPGTVPTVPRDAALTIQPFGFLVEELSGDPFDRAQAELLGQAVAETRVQDIIDALDFAKTDDRITTVHLELSGLAGGGLSKLQRIADAMDAFRESGKPIIASAEFMAQQSYFLAAHADEVYMHPDGILFLAGYGSYRNYYKDALDKLRIDWNVFRVGTHKSFAEPYIRMDMSEEDRASRTYLVDTLWKMYQDDVNEARSLEPGTIHKFANELVANLEATKGDYMQAVLGFGLIDGLMTGSEFRELMIERVGEDGDGFWPAVDMYTYIDEQTMLNGSRVGKQNVAVVVASGSFQIGDHPPGVVGSESTSSLLRRALRDDSVKAVVLRIDSPGGATFASEVIADEIRALQEAGKPVVASMGSVSASAGYFIAAGADRILASPTTITGSIGIFAMIPTYQRSLEALGIATDGVGSTIWAGQLRPDRELSESTRQLVQALIENGYDKFITHIADYRGMDKDAVDRVGQGQVWLGVDALENGLVDELGNIDDAIEVAAELAEMDSYGVKPIRRELSSAQQLMMDIMASLSLLGIGPDDFASRPSALERLARRLESAIPDIERYNDPKGVYSHCFCDIR
jgi:protease-4